MSHSLRKSLASSAVLCAGLLFPAILFGQESAGAPIGRGPRFDCNDNNSKVYPGANDTRGKQGRHPVASFATGRKSGETRSFKR
jgi:hypothetical protein